MDRGQLTGVILAGGQGTRLRPLTFRRPKPIVPLLNLPFLAYQLDLLRRHGITDVVLSCSYMVDEVRHAMADGATHGVRLRYAVETEPLGTGGGVRNAIDLVGGRVVVLNGDVLTDADISAMIAFHEARGAAATIDCYPVPDPTPYGLVETDPSGRILRFVEKPPASEITVNTINAGIYVIERSLLSRIPGDRPVSIEREFFPGLLADRIPFYGWIGEHYWIDIGSPAKYRQAQLDLLGRRVATGVGPAAPGAAPVSADAVVDRAASVAFPSVVGARSRLEAGCSVGPESVLGAGCRISRGARISGSVIWDDVSVGEGAEITDAIVASGARIGARAIVGAGVVLAADQVVPDGARLAAPS